MGTKIVRPYHFMGGRNLIFLKGNIKRFQVYISASQTSQYSQILNQKNSEIYFKGFEPCCTRKFNSRIMECIFPGMIDDVKMKLFHNYDVIMM